jgi:DNA-binding transcriptional MerR regulator
MGWSTRELAELAGATVNTVRHYHRLGLLDEPERRYNGYKQYGVRHLVRLLRIRRLTSLGVRLSQVDATGESTTEVLRELDERLVANIDRMQRARIDIAAILQEDAPADAPPGFESVASHLSEADSSLLHLYAQFYDERAMADLRRMVEVDAEVATLGNEINALTPDADEATRRHLADRLAPTIAQNLIDFPWLSDPARHLSKGERVTHGTFVEAMVELYNPAQLDVLSRAGRLAQARLPADRTTGDFAGRGPR